MQYLTNIDKVFLVGISFCFPAAYGLYGVLLSTTICGAVIYYRYKQWEAIKENTIQALTMAGYIK